MSEPVIFGINKTVEHFPDDWIAPGEFSFCHSGFHLLPTEALSPCAICSHDATGAVFDYEHALRRARLKLAQARKDAGVPQLFWMR